MRRLAAGASLTGLGLMTVGAIACRSFGVDLETRIALFLTGIVLFVVSSSGYTAAP